jgi:hypothetical protein
MNARGFTPSLRVPAALLLIGQLLYIVITQFHAGGPANDHPVIFGVYAANDLWTVDHVGQFVAMAVLLAGLFGLLFSLEALGGSAGWAGRFGAAMAVVALALYGCLQAVDGVANKQADIAWVNASDTEKVARFAGAEVVRWIEWGLRSYQNVALGLSLLLFGVAMARTPRIPRLIALLVAVTGLVYLAQGWLVGTEGFSDNMSIAIVAAWILSAVWMVWLLVVAWRVPGPEAR